jgi:hypothetical protein
MTDKTYNGWTNYATWRVNLEIFDGMDPRDMGWHKLDKYDLGLILKDYAEECLEMQCEGKDGGMSLVFSYAMAFLSDVNWREIAEMMLEAYQDEAETEEA